MHGIAGDAALALVLAAFAVFCAAMIWAGLVTAAAEPLPPRRRAGNPVTATGAPAAPPPAAAGPGAAPPGRGRCPTGPRPTG